MLQDGSDSRSCLLFKQFVPRVNSLSVMFLFFPSLFQVICLLSRRAQPKHSDTDYLKRIMLPVVKSHLTFSRKRAARDNNNII